MSDFGRLLLVFVATVNPATVLGTMARETRHREQTLAVGLGLAVVLVAAGGTWNEQIHEALDLEPETFRISAGIVMATVGALAILRGVEPYAVEDGWKGGIFPLAIPLLASPAAIAAAIAYPDEYSVGETLGAALAVIVATAALVFLLKGRGHGALGPLSRLTGALLIALAVGLIVDGVRDI